MVLGAAAGLDAEERRELHLVGIEVTPVDLLGPVEQIEERQLEERHDFGDAPVVAQAGLMHGIGSSDGERGRVAEFRRGTSIPALADGRGASAASRWPCEPLSLALFA